MRHVTHVYIHGARSRDADKTKHDPSNGQFTSGSGGGHKKGEKKSGGGFEAYLKANNKSGANSYNIRHEGKSLKVKADTPEEAHRTAQRLFDQYEANQRTGKN